MTPIGSGRDADEVHRNYTTCLWEVGLTPDDFIPLPSPSGS